MAKVTTLWRMEMMTVNERSYDVIVVGGGPGGYTAAISAAKEGLSVLLFEGEYIGGTCLNVGCIPTKYLLDKAAALEKIRALTDLHILKEAGLFSFEKIQTGREAVVKKLTGGVEYLLKANKVTVIKKFAQVKAAGGVVCDGVAYTGKDIIIATGAVPSSIPIPGAEYTITSTSALAMKQVPEKLVVIGGGVIGMELASAFCSYGSQVTVIEVLPKLFPGEEEAAVSYMTKELKKRDIRILCGTRAKAIGRVENCYQVTYEGEENGVADADVVLMATGRKANLKGIDACVALNTKGEIEVNEYMQTSIPHIYAVGDAAGGYQLAHAAYAEAEAAVNHILGKAEPVNLDIMPRCIYTMPPYAAVGVGTAQTQEKGIETVSGEFSYNGNGMALAEGAQGMVCVIMDREKQTTLGVQIVGECAPELVALASAAVKGEMTLKQWEQMIIAHPSLSEMIKEAALDCFGKSVHRA